MQLLPTQWMKYKATYKYSILIIFGMGPHNIKLYLGRASKRNFSGKFGSFLVGTDNNFGFLVDFKNH